MESIRLDASYSPTGHPCAATGLYGSDLALLNYLLQDLRALVRRSAAGRITLAAYQTLTWEVHGLRRRTVICDPARLVEPREVHIVGFFGDRRADADTATLEEVEVGLLGEFRTYPGIMSYSSVELVDDQWANLVVHAEVGDREEWRGSEVHVRAAAELAPAVYHSIRIHNGCLPGGVVGCETPVIETTKYWDYDATPAWQAVRELPRGAQQSVESPDAALH